MSTWPQFRSIQARCNSPRGCTAPSDVATILPSPHRRQMPRAWEPRTSFPLAPVLLAPVLTNEAIAPRAGVPPNAYAVRDEPHRSGSVQALASTNTPPERSYHSGVTNSSRRQHLTPPFRTEEIRIDSASRHGNPGPRMDVTVYSITKLAQRHPPMSRCI